MDTPLTIMAVLAHPDDELDLAGTLAACAAEAARVVLVCATPGDQGSTVDPALATPETLGSVRMAELASCCRVLGIEELCGPLSGDSGFRSPDPPAGSLARARAQDVVGKLVALVRLYRPHVVITYGPDGVYGHRDHRAIGAYTTAAFGAAGDERLHPEAGEPWRPRRLFYLALPEAQRRVLYKDFDAVPIGAVTHTIDVRSYVSLKEEAERCHRTQGAWFPWVAEALPAEEYVRAVGTECLVLVHDAGVADLQASGDVLRQLLAG